MPKPKLNRASERRVAQEIVVDAYTSDERALGWYYYLEEKVKFPLRARCDAVRLDSPLKKGELVEVLSLAKEDDCMREPFALIEFAGCKLGVPLARRTRRPSTGEPPGDRLYCNRAAK